MSAERVPHVLVVSTSYPLRPSSSSGVFVRRLVEALADDCRMTVLCPDDASGEPAQGGPGVELRAFRYAPRRWQRIAQNPGGVLPAIRAQPALLALLPAFLASMAVSLVRGARRADVIHANWAICGAIAGALRFAHRRPIVVTLRGDDVTAAARSGIHRWLLHLAVSRAVAVVCVAETMAQRLRADMPGAAAKISVALNGVDAFGERASESDGVLRLVYVGSLIARKGVDVLLRALAALRRTDVVLRVVGDGPERAALVALAADLGIARQVEFVGQVAPDDVAPHLASSEIFVLPSYSEGRPNVLLEAMAAGLAIVATRIAGVVDAAVDGEHAWLFEAGDVDALAAALADALARPGERRRRGDAARAEVATRGWTWTATARTYAQLFRRAASEVTG